MNIQELKEQKQRLGITNRQLAELSGVPFGTVQKVFGGSTGSPRYLTLHKLEEALRKADQGHGFADLIREPPSKIGRAHV